MKIKELLKYTLGGETQLRGYGISIHLISESGSTQLFDERVSAEPTDGANKVINNLLHDKISKVYRNAIHLDKRYFDLKTRTWDFEEKPNKIKLTWLLDEYLQQNNKHTFAFGLNEDWEFDPQALIQKYSTQTPEAKEDDSAAPSASVAPTPHR